MQSAEMFTAMNRFGLGCAPGEAKRIGNNPKSWLQSQVVGNPRVPSQLSTYPSTRKILGDIYGVKGNGAQKNQVLNHYRKIYQTEVVDRASLHISTDAPYHERLVMFWTNHLCTAEKGAIYPSMAAYEREAIRPYVFDRYYDLLISAIRHPVMLIYLDNVKSIGPNSKQGRRTGGKINENLAREILELHTLGVNGGYSQKDVIELAKALTGWTFSPKSPGADPETGFYFDESIHEPGAKWVMGRYYPESGENEAREILFDLALHPSTAKNVAQKLGRHFFGDEPPANAVGIIEAQYLRTNANLYWVSRGIASQVYDAAQAPLTKVKTPYELFISLMRATNSPDVKPMVLFRPMGEMNHMPFTAPSPAGWPDSSMFWISPEAVMRRAEWIRSHCTHIARHYKPMDVLDQTIGAVAAKQTRQVIEEAPSAADALALVFASTEFQRR